VGRAHRSAGRRVLYFHERKSIEFVGGAAVPAARSRRVTMRIRRAVCLLLIFTLTLAGLSAPALAETQPLVAPAASLRTAVWIGVAPTSVRYGQPVKVTATLVNSAGTPVPGRTVSVEQCIRAGVWTTVKSALSSTGRYAFVVYPSRRTYYRVSFAGDATYYSSKSSYLVVSTTAQLTGPVTSAVRVDRGLPITVSGYLKPRHTAGTGAVTLQAWKLVGGAWQLVKTYPAPISDSQTYSRYSANVVLPYTGSWRIRAVHADADHLWTGTGWAWVTVLTRPTVAQARAAVLAIARKEYPAIPWIGAGVSGMGKDSRGRWWVQGWTNAGVQYEVEQWFIYYDGLKWTLHNYGTGLERSDLPADIVWEDVP
jgi:hypothetical protein